MRLRLAICGLLAAGLPAAAQPRPPSAPWTPWSVESPGPLGARFGLGLDLALDRIDDAEVVGGTQSVTTIGQDGRPRTDAVPFDAGLANRKLRQDWEERSFGLQVPVALPPLHLPGSLRVEPSIVFEAAAVEADLTFVDLVEGTPDRTLDGTGARWGVGVEALGELCRGCRWFWSAGYRYRSLGGLDVDGLAPLDGPGLVTTERTEIDHDAHHLTARLGALVAGGRATVYVGARDRRGDLVVTDETTLSSPQIANETILTTRLDLDANDTAALAGADFRLGRGYVGRVEATFGGEGEGVLLKVVRAQWFGSPEERPRVIEAQRRRAESLADAIAPRVDALRKEFARRAREIEERAGPRRPLPTQEVLELLDDLENGLEDILSAPELLPILSWFLDALESARAGLEAPPESATTAHLHIDRPSSYELAFARMTPRDAGRAQRTPPVATGRGLFKEVQAWLDGLFTRADNRKLTHDICVESVPLHAAITLWPSALILSEKATRTYLRPGYTRDLKMSVLYRGLYAYQVKHEDDKRSFVCTSDSPKVCPLINLWEDDGPVLTCDFGWQSCRLRRDDSGSCGQ